MKQKPKSKSKFAAETFETIEAKHEFNNVELIDIADALTKKMAEEDALELQKKAAAADYAARIKVARKEVQEIGEKFASRSEFRPTECRVEFNAKERIKTYFRVIDGQKIKEAAMNESDFQTWFPITPPAVKKPKSVVEAAFDKAEAKKAEKEASIAS